MKVLVFLAAWKRPEITEICFTGLSRLIKNSRLTVEPFIVVSEDSMIPLCKKYGFKYTFYKNEPLGEKKNHGLTEAMKLQWDYLIEIGSDDLLKDDLLKLYEPYMNAGVEMMGTKDTVIINSEDGHSRRLISDTPYGLGRCISRKVIEKHCLGVDVIPNTTIIGRGRTTAAGEKGFFNIELAEEMVKLKRGEIVGQTRYKLWKDEINKGLDNSSNYFLMTQNVGHKTVKTDKPLCIDIKSEENIWKFNKTLGTAYDLDKALEGLSQEEQSMIFALFKRKKSNNIEYANAL